nr:hypothetical protein [uncultured Methanoregula sp.]
MADQIPFSLALFIILGIIVVLCLAELAVFYLVITRTGSSGSRRRSPSSCPASARS